jgi:hypothetical protein
VLQPFVDKARAAAMATAEKVNQSIQSAKDTAIEIGAQYERKSLLT